MSSSSSIDELPLFFPISMAIELHDKIKFLDGSWFLPGRSARQEFEQHPRIAGAHFFDIDDIADTTSTDLPHMMPSPQLFAATMDAFGIAPHDPIVVYARTPDCSMHTRAWFQIRNMGHERTHLLAASAQEFQAAGGLMDDPAPNNNNNMVWAKDLNLDNPVYATATPPQQVVSLDDVKKLILHAKGSTDTVLVDVRSPERFAGTAPEPRAGLRRGHMPGAKNVFFLNLLSSGGEQQQLQQQQQQQHLLKPKEELQRIIEQGLGERIDKSGKKKYVVSCGSGASACVLVAALQEVGVDPQQCFVYDGSWAEWGAQEDTPIV